MFKEIISNLFFKSDNKPKIYYPIYNDCFPPTSGSYPEVYNKDGEKMDFYFLRDYHTAHIPYLFMSKYFIWDRFNFGLKTHFYTHNTMLETMGNPDRRYGMLIESESIVPDDYKIFDIHKGLEKDFDSILTYSDKLLNSLSNAKFFPSCAQVWYGKSIGGGKIDEKAYEKKRKNISIISSDKIMCELHVKRLNLAKELKVKKIADTFGTFDGGKMVKIAETLTDYRYSICIENSISDYFFSERITNCFASMTVPIYYGAKKISDFFNPEGIIILKESDFNNISKVIAQCNEKDYEQRLPAILDNFKKVFNYFNMDDYLYRLVNNIK